MLELVEATGLSLYEVRTLRARLSAIILVRGGIQEARHREHSYLLALGAVADYKDLPLNKAWAAAENVRYPMRGAAKQRQTEAIQADLKKQALERIAALRGQQNGHPGTV